MTSSNGLRPILEACAGDKAGPASGCGSGCRSMATDHRRGHEHGGLKRDRAKRQTELDRENTRLRKPVSDLTLDGHVRHVGGNCGMA